MAKSRRKEKEIKKQIFDRRLTKNILFFSGGIGIIIIIVVVSILGFRAKDKLQKFTTSNEAMYTYMDQDKIDVTSTLTLNTEGTVTKMLIDGKEQDSDGIPFYYKDEKKVLFPTTLSIVFPTGKIKSKKINYYTRVTYNGYNAKLINTNLNYQPSNAFIYNGSDFYFFLEETTIKFGEEEVKVSPLSYAIVRYHDEMYIYDYENDEMKYYEKVESNVYAEATNYEINMSNDTCTVGESSFILVKKFDNLSNLY